MHKDKLLLVDVSAMFEPLLRQRTVHMKMAAATLYLMLWSITVPLTFFSTGLTPAISPLTTL